MHILFVLKTAFSIWMLVDAAKRQAPIYWFWIILMPFGEVVYFLAVKINDPEIRAVKHSLFPKRTSLKELRYNLRHNPSVHNKQVLAQALHDRSEFRESMELFREVLSRDEKSKSARYGLARCLIETGNTDEVVRILEAIVDDDFSYEDFFPCADLASLYWQNGKHQEAIDLLLKVAKKNSRVTHAAQLSQYLIETNQSAAARSLLEQALDDYKTSPRWIKSNDRRAAAEARKLLKSLH